MTEHYLDRLARTINENWDSPAFTDFYLTEDGTTQDTSRGDHYTYGELYAEILCLGELFKDLGLQKGDHIAICGANSAHWAIAYLAIAAYQGVAVTILHSQSPEDIARQIDFSDAKVLFTDVDLWGELKDQSLPQVAEVISLSDWQILRGKVIVNYQLPIANHQCQFVHGAPDELAMICFTSGSTGVSKGVMLSYRNLSNVVLNEIKGCFSPSANTHYTSLLPLSHMYGLMTDLISHSVLGKHIYMPKIKGLKDILTTLILTRPYAIVTIPNILEKLYAIDKNLLISSLSEWCEQLYLGGASASQEVLDAVRTNRIPVSTGYGLSETCFLISYAQSSDYKRDSVGHICAGMTARIAANGEILVKGENVMLGYYKAPEATARKIDKDGWLHTGDKGHLDEDGYLYVEGRLNQDMIVLPNGENIHPEDIERKINALPEVSESIVIARDGKLVAIVVPQMTNDQSSITNADLRRHVLRSINPELPLYSQLYDVEITDTALQKTEKQTIKRYLYK